MRIIKPLLEVGSLSESNAPIDALDTWAPIGRDLLNYVEKPIFDIVGNTMVITSSTLGGIVYSVDLVTGIVTDTGYSAGLSEVLNIDLSQDASDAYICTSGGTAGSRRNFVFDVISGVVNYSSGDIPAGPVITGAINNSHWHSDSSRITFTSGRLFIYVDSTTWTEASVNIGGAFTLNIESLEFNGTDFYMIDKESIVASNIINTDVNGAFLNGVDSPYMRSVNNDSLIYNQITGDMLILSSDGFKILNQSTLAVEIPPANLSGSFFSGARSVNVTATHLITRSLSTSPYWNYRLLTDYSLDKSLPTLQDIGEGVASATDYTVVQQDNGIALLDSLDVPITQVNPSVIVGDKYIYIDRTYEVLIDNNDEPETGTVIEPASWLDTGPINPLRMFDGALDSLTTAAGALVVSIIPGEIVTGIALFNVTASVIRITMTDPVEGLVYDSGDISMIDNSSVNNWFDFWFDAYSQKTDFATLDLPPYTDATIEVTISNEGFGVSVGEIIIGRTIGLGAAQFGTSVGNIDFSKKERDQFGNFIIVKRGFTKRAEYDVKIPTNTVSGVKRTLSDITSEPVVWVGDVNREETIIYGYYLSFDIFLSAPSLSTGTITVEGL